MLRHPLSPLGCFIGGSIIVWIYAIIAWRGIKGASILNAVITIAKVMPLLLVVIVGISVFHWGTFSVPHWQTVLASTGRTVSLPHQLGQVMSTIVWCFVGIEAAVSMSRRAKKPADVGLATVISFVIVLILYIIISVVPMGILPARQLAKEAVPLAAVLKVTPVGQVGSYIIKIGLLVSLLGALLSWYMIGPEIAYVTSLDHDMPRPFSLVNTHDIPGFSLIVYTLIMQLFLLVLLIPQLQKAYTIAYTLAAAMTLVAYLLSALYGLKVAFGEKRSLFFKVVALLASLYSIYTLFVSGIQYVFASALIFALGIPLFIRSAKQVTRREWSAIVVIAVLGILVLILILTGQISF